MIFNNFHLFLTNFDEMYGTASNACRAWWREWDVSRVCANRFPTRTRALDHLKVDLDRFGSFHLPLNHHDFW